MNNKNSLTQQITITYQEFEDIIIKIKKIIEFQNSLDNICRMYSRSKKTSDDVGIYLPSLVDDLISLLKKVMNDKYEWIEYWIFEIDFGKKGAGSAKDENENDIPLFTIKDLWDELCKCNEM